MEPDRKETPSNCCCIVVKESNEPVPLKAIKVSVGVSGYLVNVDSSLSYENKGDKPIEAVFRFPVDENGAVYKFEMEIDGKIVIAKCQEKEEAKKSYDEAVEHGYTASYLGESDSASDVFTCKLGNLQPGKSALVRFAYVSELAILEDGSLEFVLPTLLNPRYNPSPEKGGLTEVPKDKYVKGCDQPYTFEIDVNVEGVGKMLDITSAKDKLDASFENDKTKALVKLSEKFIADHDFGFKIQIEDAHKPKVLIEKGKNDAEGLLKNDIMMLNFFPKLNSSCLSNKHEFMFIIDRSGSMHGSRIKEAKDSLLLFLKSLPTGCYFNIIGFGSNFEALFKESSVPYTEESLKTALNYQEVLDADMGGTEILEPLQYVYKQALIPTHSRQVFLITDGEVYNTSSIIRLVQINSHATKVFTLGIGEGASTSLVKGVARAGRGKAEFVKSGERMQPVVMRLLKYAMQISVTNVSIDWRLGGSVDLTQIPQELPPIFDADRLIVYAVVSNRSVLDGRIVLKGDVGDDKLDFPVEVNANRDVLSSANEDSMLVHRMAAKLQIKHLQDSDDAEKKTNKAAIVALSLSTNVVSNYTAMIGIDKSSKKPTEESMITCTIPNVMDPTLSYGRMARCYAMPPMMMSAPCAYPPQMRGCAAPQAANSMLKGKRKLLVGGGPPGAKPNLGSNFESDVAECDSFGMGYASFDQTAEQSSSVAEPRNVFLEIVSLVEFSGHWKFHEKLFNILSLKAEDVKKSSLVKDLDVWSTALVLSYFELKCADIKEEWEMIKMKATQWMSKQDLEGHSVDDVVKQAGQIIP